jgi:predicted ATPase with chaperone activity
MLAPRLTTLLPAMTLAETLETTRIYRVAVLTGDCLTPDDRAGVESVHTAHVDRQRAAMPPGETCPLPLSASSAPCHGRFSQ